MLATQPGPERTITTSLHGSYPRCQVSACLPPVMPPHLPRTRGAGAVQLLLLLPPFFHGSNALPASSRTAHTRPSYRPFNRSCRKLHARKLQVVLLLPPGRLVRRWQPCESACEPLRDPTASTTTLSAVGTGLRTWSAAGKPKTTGAMFTWHKMQMAGSRATPQAGAFSGMHAWAAGSAGAPFNQFNQFLLSSCCECLGGG